MKKLVIILTVFTLYFSACTPKSSHKLGEISTGTLVSLVKDTSGVWGLEITDKNKVLLNQPQPVQIEIYQSENEIQQLSTGYTSVNNNNGIATAEATIETESGTSFQVTDQWEIVDQMLTIKRTLSVVGTQAEAGFSSAISLLTSPEIGWEDVNFLAPGLLYGDPSFDGASSPGGTNYDKAKIYTFREDYLPAPFLGMTLPNGSTLTLLDMDPDGTSTYEETQSGNRAGVLVNEKLAVGTFRSKETEGGNIEFGFCQPNSTALFERDASGRRFRLWGGDRPSTLEMEKVGLPGGLPAENYLQRPQFEQEEQELPNIVWCRRYNPVQDGFTQEYQLGFRFAANETFPELTKNAYRWAWSVLQPELFWHDIDVVRKSLTDQLSSLVTYMDGRAGLPYQVYTKTGQVWDDPNDPNFWWRCPMGFVGKIVEAGDELLREGDRDKTERGQKMRQQGLDIISTCMSIVDMKNPTCTGYNLRTGGPSMTNPPIWYIREATDDLRMLMEAYRREKTNGIDHPDWLQWCKDFADWTLNLQREDGSFPRSFLINTAQVVEESGTTSYNVVPLFVMLSQDLNDSKYLESAVIAAEHVWESYGKRGVFIGGAIDNPNITDKEAGLLSMEAFLFLYEETKDEKWLDRAKVAGDFAMSWTYIWDVPMHEELDNDTVNWIRGVPTTGVQGITAAVAGHVDQFLDMSAAAYAKLYRYTGDEQYLEYARLLLHNTKAMVALPGRLYGMYAPGYQTENFRMGTQRGFGTPQKWMTWITTNHLYSIVGLEQFDKALFEELCAKPE
ncbi:MAG TPA: hypothetical protein VEP89_18155 [Draconibacterium sp.]|nr:hypothetical protein [Draconibacterium sp.]